MNLSMLGADFASEIITMFRVLVIAFAAIIVICAIIIIGCIMATDSNTEGSSALTGATNDSYYGKNKGKNKDGRMVKIIIACSVLIFVLTIALVLIWRLVFNNV
jgi:preprotein translocase subunit SecG